MIASCRAEGYVGLMAIAGSLSACRFRFFRKDLQAYGNKPRQRPPVNCRDIGRKCASGLGKRTKSLGLRRSQNPTCRATQLAKGIEMSNGARS